jgi:predicted GTPase
MPGPCEIVLMTILFLFPSFFGEQESSGSAVPMVLVINKVDCAPFVPGEQFEQFSGLFKKHVHTCAVTGKGISELESAVVEVRGLEAVPSGGRRWTVNQVIQYIQQNIKGILILV